MFFSSLLFKPLLWQVTAFTLAHSVTLFLAAVLSDYGIPRDDVVSSLFAFNIAVELRQITIILVVFAVTHHLKEKANYRKSVQIPMPVAIGLVRLFGFIERILL